MILEEFKQIYQDLDESNIESIELIYASDVQFNDPFHQVEGLQHLKDYFHGLYENVKAIDFEFGDSISEDDGHFIHWTMNLTHPKLNKGKTFKVPGASYLKVNSTQQIVFHRDYFDAGVMLYEQLPIFGKLVKMIKNQL